MEGNLCKKKGISIAEKPKGQGAGAATTEEK